MTWTSIRTAICPSCKKEIIYENIDSYHLSDPFLLGLIKTIDEINESHGIYLDENDNQMFQCECNCIFDVKENDEIHLFITSAFKNK